MAGNQAISTHGLLKDRQCVLAGAIVCLPTVCTSLCALFFEFWSSSQTSWKTLQDYLPSLLHRLIQVFQLWSQSSTTSWFFPQCCSQLLEFTLSHKQCTNLKSDPLRLSWTIHSCLLPLRLRAVCMWLPNISNRHSGKAYTFLSTIAIWYNQTPPSLRA